jgi:Holliday junction resolvase RusA-like endonuclease
LAVTIEAIFGVAKSDSLKKRQAKLCGLLRPVKRPDFDNIAKIVCDALNGVAWHDDAQIVNAQVIKLYGVEPCVKVWISKEDT